MTQTLLTAASGLLAHQRKLDIVGNNLANINTTSYKAQKILFADLLYNTFQPASGSADTNSGGSNPKQIGFGVDVASISKNFGQGVLTSTGEQFDFALQGDGFFVVGGEQQLYTRDGAFSLDKNGNLVDPSTGGLVQRFGSMGEPIGSEPGFQIPGDNRIVIPLGAAVPGERTTEAEFIGNLPASAVPPLAEVLITTAAFQSGGAAATTATALNDLDSNVTDYQAGDTINIVGTNVDGSSFNVALAVDATTTMGDLVTAVNGQLVGSSLALTADGNLELTADETGESALSINISDESGNVGETDFLQHPFTVETEGKNGDTFESTVQVFDSRGAPHTLQATFEKKGNNHWDARFSSGEEGVTMTDGLVQSITFNEDGTFSSVNGVGDGDSNIELEIDSLSEPLEIDIALRDMTHQATSFSATFEQDGFPPGNIVSVNVAGAGILEGIATNGKRVTIAQLAVATFVNELGLESEGGNYYIETSNSGSARVGTSLTNGAGQVRGGQLETSNVDVALEFTQLIVAQRGFSANARTITVATEVLEELTNIIR